MKLTSERLIHAIANQIEPYESSDALKILRDDYGFTDEEIREMGFDYLFDLESNEEPEEKPLKKYEFLYTESWSTVYTVYAHDENEAWKMTEDIVPDTMQDLVPNDDGSFTMLES